MSEQKRKLEDLPYINTIILPPKKKIKYIPPFLIIDISSIPKCEECPDGLVCPICWENIAEEDIGLAGTNPCECVFHSYCINKWTNNILETGTDKHKNIARDCCPVCRKPCLWKFYKYLDLEYPDYRKFWTGISNR